jgi:hypothetical protein
VSARWLWSGLLLSLACSEAEVRPDEQPRLVLGCEEGRVAAYLVIGGASEVESGSMEDQAVRVDLDSAPACLESAP